MKKIMVLLFALLWGGLLPVNATIYYVKPSGNNLSEGTSWENAFRDPGKALMVAKEDDEIRIAGGNYQPEAGQSYIVSYRITILGGFKGTGNNPDERNPYLYPTILKGNLTSIMLIDADVNINGCSFLDGGKNPDHNPANSIYGGGIRINTGNAMIRECNFENCMAGYGGAIYIHNANVTIEECGFYHNYATVGGAVCSHNTKPYLLTIGKSILNENKTFSYGGAIDNTGDFLIYNTQVRGNRSGDRGGAFNINEGTCSLYNCLITGNRADTFGGAIYIGKCDSIEFVNVTLSCNYANIKVGGILLLHGSAKFTNSILWGNKHTGNHLPNDRNFDNVYDSTALWRYNILENCIQNGKWQKKYGTNLGNNHNVSPNFYQECDASQNSTISGNFRISPFGPACNTGLNDVNPYDKDIEGRPRRFGDNIDIGAYEMQYHEYRDCGLLQNTLHRISPVPGVKSPVVGDVYKSNKETIYPNPAKKGEFITIELPEIPGESHSWIIEIYHTSGIKLCTNEMVSGNTSRVRLPDKSGLYMILIKSGDGAPFKCEKLIVI